VGDRGNIVIRQEAGGPGAQGTGGGYLFLYTHWGGSELPGTLQRALVRGRDRWDDESYLARIIFREMGAGSEEDNTGFGISTYLTDNEHDLLVVDCGAQTVSVVPAERFPKPRKTWSFADFVKAHPESLGFE
jgi:hypothetical protein